MDVDTTMNEERHVDKQDVRRKASILLLGAPPVIPSSYSYNTTMIRVLTRSSPPKDWLASLR